VASGINDPYEADNRRMHAFNKALDSAVVGRGAEGFAAAVPEPVRRGIGNVADNLDLPRLVVNGVLQGRAEDALANTFRLAINTTVGLGGLLDPATAMGLPVRQTDFGETLHVWGWGEGRYLELPVLGPSTERDALGKVVDAALNPLRYALPPAERNAAIALGVLSRLDDRARFSGTVDSILYESADSYAQARLLYLQNRRFELGGEAGADYEDPYEDPYFDPYADPYAE
jgi:phospholipid-binding lipoprotein MlaA